MEKQTVLIIDDELIGFLFRRFLESQNYDCKGLIKDINNFKSIFTASNVSLIFINADIGIAEGKGDSWKVINEIIGTPGNYSPIIFYSLQNKVSFQKEAEKNCPELCQHKDLWEIIQLPKKLPVINSTINNLLQRYSTQPDSERKELCSKVAKRLATEQDVSQRHGMGNAMAASRILNGAFASGDYNLIEKEVEKQAKKAYYELTFNETSNLWDDTTQNSKYKDALETIEKTKNALESKGFKSDTKITPWHEKITKVLVIDDQQEMWEPVWGFILGKEKVKVVKEGEAGLDEIVKNKYDCVILDMWLGDDKKNGIEILQCIKQEQIALPVIMVTAYDDASIIYESYRQGAYSYFCKEREDTADRDSVKYYKKVTDLIIGAADFSQGGIYEFWRRILNIEKKLPNNEWQDAVKDLKRAYFFLTVDSEEFRVKRFLCKDSENSQFIEAIFYTYRCLDKILNIELKSICVVESKVKSFKSTPTSKKFSILKGKPNIPDLIELLKYGPPSGHPSPIWKKKEKELPNIEKNCLSEFLDWIEKYKQLNNTLTFSIQQSCKFEEFKLKEYHKVADNRLSHPERARAGAIRLLEGAYLSQNSEAEIGLQKSVLNIKEDNIQRWCELLIEEYEQNNNIFIKREFPQYYCLFIDDDGEKSGWKMVMEKVLPDVHINYVEYSGEANSVIKDIDLFDFIILDLKLPVADGTISEENGIKLLDQIKEQNPAIPVLVLTASDDVLWTRKSLTHGAIDYFPKTNRDYRDIKEREYFTGYYNRFRDIINKIVQGINEYKYKDIYKAISFIDEAKLFEYLDVSEELESGIKKSLGYFLVDSQIGPLSHIVHNRIVQYLNTTYFYYTPDRSITLSLPIKKLFGHSPDTLLQQAVITCGEIVEFCLKLSAIICKKGFGESITIGTIINDSKFNDFRNECSKSIKNHIELVNKIWATRNRIKNNPSALILTEVKSCLDDTFRFIFQTSVVLWEFIFQKLYERLSEKRAITIKDDIIEIYTTKKTNERIWNDIKYRLDALNLFVEIYIQIKKAEKKLWKQFAYLCFKDIVVRLLNITWTYKKVPTTHSQKCDDLEKNIKTINETYSIIEGCFNDKAEEEKKKANLENELNTANAKWAERASDALDQRTAEKLTKIYGGKINEIQSKINAINEILEKKEQQLNKNKQSLNGSITKMPELLEKQWEIEKEKRKNNIRALKEKYFSETKGITLPFSDLSNLSYTNGEIKGILTTFDKISDPCELLSNIFKFIDNLNITEVKFKGEIQKSNGKLFLTDTSNKKILLTEIEDLFIGKEAIVELRWDSTKKEFYKGVSIINNIELQGNNV
jgi:response regulator of citrate/malate metabolism